MAKSDFATAAANVKSAPHSTAAWDELEELARETDKPDDVIAAYRDELQGGLDPQVIEMIGERAAAFCDEWFGDEPKVAEGILGKVLDLAPQSETALGRLSVLYTQHERWADLLRLYDRALTAVKDGGRRVKLLREAAQLAKDVANQPEKAIGYPADLAAYQKPGTGVWTIDRLSGPAPDRLDVATLESVLGPADQPEYLHVKDPVVFDLPGNETALLFCSHPYCWSSGNTGLAVRPSGATAFALRTWEVTPRGPAWDVASTRLTCRLPVPAIGCFAGQPSCSVYFYDGCECVRPHDENPHARRRPRGYSCEELGGAMVGLDAEFPSMRRLSRLAPLFVSPHGTGCSRYVDVTATPDGLLALWQQSQPDGSQPLVGHLLPHAQVERILAGRD